jgi:hypothetical protein
MLERVGGVFVGILKDYLLGFLMSSAVTWDFFFLTYIGEGVFTRQAGRGLRARGATGPPSARTCAHTA